METYAPPEGETFGVFVFAGYEPASRLAEGLAELTGQGNIVTDREQRTRTEGVYAAGDVCDKRLRQVVTAVSDGAVAATSIERYAADMQRKTGLRPQRPATAPASSGASKASAPSGNARETEGGFLTAEQREQLAGVFARMERPLILKAAPTNDFFPLDRLAAGACISAPCVPCIWTLRAPEGASVWHDPLQLGTSVMLLAAAFGRP